MNESIKKAYAEKMHAQVDEWKSRLETLRAKGAQMAADVKIDYGKQIGDWQSKEKELKLKMEELAASGIEKFEILKTGTETLWSDMKKIAEQLTEKKH